MTLFPIFPHWFVTKWWDQMPWSSFFKCCIFTLLFTFIKRLFNSLSLSAIKVVSSAYLRLLVFLSAVSIPVCASSTPAFCMMYSAYKLNKQDDSIQPFPILNLSVVLCPVLTIASCPAYRFLERQVRSLVFPSLWEYWEGGSGWGIHVNPWLIHVNVWQKPLQYCKVISLQLIKLNEKKRILHSLMWSR